MRLGETVSFYQPRNGATAALTPIKMSHSRGVCQGEDDLLNSTVAIPNQGLKLIQNRLIGFCLLGYQTSQILTFFADSLH